MPNNLVFNRVASDLKVQIYGLYSNTATAVAVDASGNLLISGAFYNFRRHD